MQHGLDGPHEDQPTIAPPEGAGSRRPREIEHVKPAHSVLADEARAREILTEAVPELASGAWRLLSWELQDLRGGRRKPVALYAIAYANGAGSPVSAEVALKVFRAKRHRAAIAHAAATALWADGFRPPLELRIPRPYGYAPRLSAVVSETGAGTPWADALYEDAATLEAASARAAAWLLRLQRARVEAPPAEADGEARAERFVADLQAAHPAHGADLEALLGRLRPRLVETGQPPVPSHGDFHPKNVLLTPGTVTAIDLDGFAAREPGADVGWAIGQLLAMSHFRLGDSARGAQAALAFWRAYAPDGAATWDRVATHVAWTYLDVLHYVLCGLRTDKVELLETWPRVAQAWLESDGPELLEELRGGSMTRTSPPPDTRSSSPPRPSVAARQADPLPVAELAAAWDLGAWDEPVRLAGGKSEHYRVETPAGAHVLRRSYAAKSLGDVRFEHELVAYLRAHGYPAPEVVPAGGGAAEVVLDGRVYRLTAWVDGSSFEAGNDRQLAAAGRALARYHRLVEGFAPSLPAPEVPRLRDKLAAAVDAMAAAGDAPGGDPEVARRVGALATPLVARGRDVVALLDRLAPALPVVTLHGGCRRGSAIFRGDELAAVLDFDSARRDVRALDIAVALHDYAKVYTARGAEDHKVLLDLDVVARFMAAYRETEPLTPQELEAVPALLAARPLGRALRKCRKRLSGERELLERDLAKIDRELARVTWLDEHAGELRAAMTGSPPTTDGAT